MNLPSALVGWSKNASFVFDWVRNDGDVVNSVSHNGPGFPTLVAIPLCEKKILELISLKLKFDSLSIILLLHHSR